MSGEDSTRVELGVITGARGLAGEVRITAYTATPEDIAAYGPLQDESGARSIRILSLKSTGKGGGSVLAARLDGVTSREAAEALKGTRLFVDRAALPAPEEDSWYAHDLVGLAVEDEAGKRLGTVKAMQDFGAGDLLEIAFEGRQRAELLPFTRAFVPEVDLAGGRIVIALPEGFFDSPKPGSRRREGKNERP